MRINIALSFLALGNLGIVSGTPVPNSGLEARDAYAAADTLPLTGTSLEVRQTSIVEDLGTLFAGLDNLTGTVSAAIDSLIGTFFGGGSGPLETAQAIGIILNKSGAFVTALAGVLAALKGCK